jgi:F-box and WD-40 domain protein CDC4
MLDRSNLPPRPLSETGHYYSSDEPMTGLLGDEKVYDVDDVEMDDAQPSTAPPRPTGVTFFHDD